MKLASWVAALLAVGTCVAQPVEEKPVSATSTPAARAAAAGTLPAAPPAQANRPAIGDFGVDLAAGDPHVRPGDDFFAYASGTWYAAFTIPADHASFGPFDRLDELSKERVRGIIEQAGLAPAQADLQRIAAAKTPEAVARLFGEPGFASLFDVQLPADFRNPDRYSVFISESSLGLPDRDYYLKDDPQLKELRSSYVAYIGEMLTLGG